MQKQGDVYAVAEAAAQEFLLGEIEYETAAARIEAQLDPSWHTEEEAQNILDSHILRFYDEELFREILERTAKLVMNGTIEHYCAVKRVQSLLRPLERSRGTFESWDVAQELLDQYLLKPQ